MYSNLTTRKALLASLLSSVFLAACGGGSDAGFGGQAVAAEGTSEQTATKSSVQSVEATSESTSEAATAAKKVKPGTAALTWTKSANPNVTSYRVYYGMSSGHYSQAFGAGEEVTTTSYTQAGLQKGVVYYFAVTAIDNSTGLESAYSEEAIKVVQ